MSTDSPERHKNSSLCAFVYGTVDGYIYKYKDIYRGGKNKTPNNEESPRNLREPRWGTAEIAISLGTYVFLRYASERVVI